MNDHDGKRTLIICQGTGCVSSGSLEVRSAIERVALDGLDDVEIKATGCHGFCQRGPVVVAEPQGVFYSEMKAEHAGELMRSQFLDDEPVEHLLYRHPRTDEPIRRYQDIPFYALQQRVVLRNCGHIDPEDIDEYLGVGGYEALRRVLAEMTPVDVIEEIKRSGLRGRGGAGFPTGLKWEFCHQAQGSPKYMICNADEGDPGAFMDRSILEADPHSVLEGLLIAAYAIGASQGYFYVRAEYPLSVSHVRTAIEQARARGFLGERILGTDFSFEMDVMEGAGAFVCGEETALLASIEGRSGRPRPRPPFPAQSGLWGRPTTINNVKTAATVPVIISRGADWFSAMGTERSHGTAVFALTGHVANSGLVEVPMGTTLRTIVQDIGGGVPRGKALKAVQTGGPSGGCLPARMLDMPVDFEHLAEAGSIMGSGGMVAMDEDTCMVDIARYFLDFTQRESCGKCVPCRLGTKQMLDVLEDICAGRGRPEDIELLEDLADAVKAGSLCGLGQTAPNPVLTTLEYFREEYEAHIHRKECPAVVCKEIISSPCQHACPIDTEAQVYISLIAEGRFADAFDNILEDNPLPSVCARVCHHPCESKCEAGKWGNPIAIRALKRFATDWAIEAGVYPRAKRPAGGGASVGIVGSGPAGLMAGYRLACEGYAVTIYEAEEIPGGALSLYLPEYRIPRAALNADIQNIVNAGVEIRTRTRVGQDVSLEALQVRHEAVFIATGAHKARTLGLVGEHAAGVAHALDFLRDVNLHRDVSLGARVCVIGGGNSAVDAARSANRCPSVEQVTIVYRRTYDEMPAFHEEVDAAVDEGVDLMLLTAPVRIVSYDGRVTGLECRKMELGDFDASGRRRPEPVPGSEFVVELDNLLIAIGEDPAPDFLGHESAIATSSWGTIEVHPGTFETAVPGVFAGGDVVTGANNVIEAMSAGKHAAAMIDMHLRGEQPVRDYALTRPSTYRPAAVLTEEEVETADRPAIPVLPPAQRVNNDREVDLRLPELVAVAEARRCLRCDLETEAGKQALRDLAAASATAR